MFISLPSFPSQVVPRAGQARQWSLKRPVGDRVHFGFALAHRNDTAARAENQYIMHVTRTSRARDLMCNLPPTFQRELVRAGLSEIIDLNRDPVGRVEQLDSVFHGALEEEPNNPAVQRLMETWSELKRSYHFFPELEVAPARPWWKNFGRHRSKRADLAPARIEITEDNWFKQAALVLNGWPEESVVDKALKICALGRIRKMPIEFRERLIWALQDLPKRPPSSMPKWILQTIHEYTFQKAGKVTPEAEPWFSSEEEQAVLDEKLLPSDATGHFAVLRFLARNNIKETKLTAELEHRLRTKCKNLEQINLYGRHSNAPAYALCDILMEEQLAGRPDSKLSRLAWEYLGRAFGPKKAGTDILLKAGDLEKILNILGETNMPVAPDFLPILQRFSPEGFYKFSKDYFPSKYSGLIYYPEDPECEKKYISDSIHYIEARATFVCGVLEHFKADSDFCEKIKDAVLKNTGYPLSEMFNLFRYAQENQKDDPKFYADIATRIEIKVKPLSIHKYSQWEEFRGTLEALQADYPHDPILRELKNTIEQELLRK